MPVGYVLSSVWVRLNIISQLSVIQYMELCVLSLPISLVMIERIYTVSYCHHQIGSMNYSPLFRVRSWTIVCAVSLSIFLHTVSRTHCAEYCLKTLRDFIINQPFEGFKACINVIEYVIFGSSTGLSPVWHQAINWINAVLRSIHNCKFRDFVKDKTVSQPSYLWNRSLHTWKDGRYIETGPWSLWCGASGFICSYCKQKRITKADSEIKT